MGEFVIKQIPRRGHRRRRARPAATARHCTPWSRLPADGRRPRPNIYFFVTAGPSTDVLTDPAGTGGRMREGALNDFFDELTSMMRERMHAYMGIAPGQLASPALELWPRASIGMVRAAGELGCAHRQPSSGQASRNSPEALPPGSRTAWPTRRNPNLPELTTASRRQRHHTAAAPPRSIRTQFPRTARAAQPKGRYASDPGTNDP